MLRATRVAKNLKRACIVHWQARAADHGRGNEWLRDQSKQCSTAVLGVSANSQSNPKTVRGLHTFYTSFKPTKMPLTTSTHTHHTHRPPPHTPHTVKEAGRTSKAPGAMKPATTDAASRPPLNAMRHERQSP